MFLDDDETRHVAIPDALPVLPLRDAVVLPMTLAPISVTVDRSMRLVSDAMAHTRLVAIVAQKSPETVHPRASDLFRVGTMAIIRELVRSSQDAMHIAVQGIARLAIVDVAQVEPYLVARVMPAPESVESGIEIEALTRAAHDLFGRLVPLIADLSDDLSAGLRALEDPKELAYLIASTVPLSVQDRQELLELDSTKAKLRRVIDHLHHELSVRQLVNKIAADTSAEMSKAQREAILRKHMEQIQRELGEADPDARDVLELRARIEEARLPDEAKKEAGRELDRLERTPSISPEHGMIRTYVEWCAKLPWSKPTGGAIDVLAARRVLDEDHYDIEKVKDRIVEHLAVKRLRDERGVAAWFGDELLGREPILCLVGPPGVGKTSLGCSIARAMGRKFVRMSLGGVHDEAEVRGHRRTYIGSMPGRILQAMARADASDPVLMLDEVDKLGQGFHGDPASALLEVLDPAQNHAFVDSYLGVPFDLSRVLFICTANATDSIPAALLDRMEVLSLAGYTDEEKLLIAQRFLIPKGLRAHGLRDDELAIDEAALRRLIREHTREAGVRGLGRELGSILRKAARRIGEGGSTPIVVRREGLTDYLGPPRFFDDLAERLDRAGIATGLAWTPAGGELLFVEATSMPSDDEKLVLTGMLGNVMKESAHAALSYVRANSERLGIDARAFAHKTVHVHVPAGSIPKDGPSAGLTMIAAIASLATGRLVRHDLAMTGEITLRGKVLPVGGIKEKVLAAHRAGIRTIVLPKRNEAAESDVPPPVRAAIDLVYVESAEEALSAALEPEASREEPAAPSVH